MILIYGIADQLNPIKTKLSDVIQASMTDALGLPEGKRAHRFIPMQKEDFYYPEGRSEAYTVIEINMMQGRQPDTIKKLIKTLFANIEMELGIAPVNVEITVHEQPPHCWGFRGLTGDEAMAKKGDLNYKVNV